MGRLGLKALIYFEVATTLALGVGLLVVNLAEPGKGVVIQQVVSGAAALPAAHPSTIPETLVHAFPASVVAAMAGGDVLQLVVFSVIFGLAVVAAGERAAPVVTLCTAVAGVMFKFTDIIMRFAPIGVGAAIAVTVGRQGPGMLGHLAILVGTLYAALIVFSASSWVSPASCSSFR